MTPNDLTRDWRQRERQRAISGSVKERSYHCL
jgi:hypothetical protein